MNQALSHLFSFVCGQCPEHVWTCGDWTLPCCQRCTGLYVGALLAVVWHALAMNFSGWRCPLTPGGGEGEHPPGASAAHRFDIRGFIRRTLSAYRPTNAARWCQAALILQMVPFGFHWLPQGPLLRCLTGLLFAFGLVGLLWPVRHAISLSPATTHGRRTIPTRVQFSVSLRSGSPLPSDGRGVRGEGLGTGDGRGEGSASCSAEFHSAVSPSCTRQSVACAETLQVSEDGPEAADGFSEGGDHPSPLPSPQKMGGRHPHPGPLPSDGRGGTDYRLGALHATGRTKFMETPVRRERENIWTHREHTRPFWVAACLVLGVTLAALGLIPLHGGRVGAILVSLAALAGLSALAGLVVWNATLGLAALWAWLRGRSPISSDQPACPKSG
jgi:hypothetical protein